MPHPSAVSLFLLASASAASAPIPAGRMDGVEIAQVTIRGQIIVRVPSAALAASAPRGGDRDRPVRWVEKNGPKCIEADRMGGAIVNGNEVDLVMRGGDRIRAKLDGDCAGLGYYGGFYLKPSSDGKICAGRDTIRTRLGDRCVIKRFHKLVAKR